MKTLGGLNLKFSPCKFGENETIWSSRKAAVSMNRQETRNHVTGNKKHVSVGFPLAVSNSSAKTLAHTQLQTNVTTEENQEAYAENRRIVQVRFSLQKQCDFGEHFLIVGDNPMIGSWNSSEAVPLNWSEGHVWTVDLNMQIEEGINYKFVLKGLDGSITWQQGPDRVFTPYESEKRIVVSEDWYDPNLQRVNEEEHELIIANGHHSVSAEKLFTPMVADEETKIVSEEEVPVLVPGLIAPVTNEEIDEALKKVERKDHENTIASENAVSAKNIDEEDVFVSLHHTETIEELVESVDEKERSYGEEESGKSILEGDMQWGRRTLQKFLSKIGLQIS